MPHNQTTTGHSVKQITECIAKINNNWKNIFWATLILPTTLYSFHRLTGLPILFNPQGNLDPRAITFSGGFSTIVFFGILFHKEKKLHLFHTILVWVLLGLFAYTILSAMWSSGNWPDRLFSGWHTIEGDRLDQVKTTLTTIGGIGGVGYLVIKYRERSASERGDADEKLLNAVQQLGDSSAQVRIAGVYALADVADTYRSSFPQRIVDILCGYLRTPREKDGATESTIFKILSQHLRPDSQNRESSWSGFEIDLHGATLTETLDLSGCHFNGLADFEGTKFQGKTTFREAKFEEFVSFRSAEFQEVDFLGYTDPAGGKHLTFSKGASFENATFHKDIDFEDFIFDHEAKFKNATFKQRANFQDVTFKKGFDFTRTSASNSEATFDSVAIFKGATFNRGDSLPVSNTDEHSDQTDFNGTIFNGKADFSESTFTDEVSFRSAEFQEVDFLGYTDPAGGKHLTFSKGASFENATFHKDIDFEDFIFDHEAKFKNATFKQRANFQEAIFEQNADFHSASFMQHSNCSTFDILEHSNQAEFNGTIFNGKADFSESTFTDEVSFRSAEFQEVDFLGYTDPAGGKHLTFSKGASFENATFHKDIDFEDFIFDHTFSCRGAAFKGNASFRNSRFKKEANFSSTPVYTEFRIISKDNYITLEHPRDFELTSFYYKKVIFFKDVDFEDVVFEQIVTLSCEYREHSSYNNAKFKSGVFFDCSFAKLAQFSNIATETMLNYFLCTFNEGVIFSKTSPENGIHFGGVELNIAYACDVMFDGFDLSDNGLPEGASWTNAEDIDSSLHQHGESPTDKQSEPDEIPPADGLPQDEGGEEDGDQDA